MAQSPNKSMNLTNNLTDSIITPDFRNKTNLLWLDMEMTGLDYIDNVIIEVAVIISDANLNTLAQSDSFVIFQPETELIKMDKWNLSTHNKSGLIAKVKNSTLTIDVVEAEILKLAQKYLFKDISPLCGNSIHQDRKFVAKYMPTLDNFLHYRNIDVSTIKELAKRWYPEIFIKFKKHNRHQALSDILESIAELKYYREKLFIPFIE